MTTDKVKAKIQELCPDVMELKFGCEIGTNAGGIETCFVVGKQLNSWRCYAKHIDGTVSFIALSNFGENFEILGSPITLAVVLRAIQTTEYQSFLNLFLQGNNLMLESRSRFTYWDIEQDNYDAQSQETKDFIGSLILVRMTQPNTIATRFAEGFTEKQTSADNFSGRNVVNAPSVVPTTDTNREKCCRDFFVNGIRKHRSDCTSTDTSDWRERFDEEFPKGTLGAAVRGSRLDLLAFIAKELEQARDNDAQIIETLKDTIEGHKRLVPFFIKDGQAIERARIIALAEGEKYPLPYANANNGWQKELEGEEKGANTALDTLISKIKANDQLK